MIDLPIRPDGEMNYVLPIPDRWAHHERWAWRVERRYDRIWRMLRGATDAETDSLLAPVEKTRKVEIARCEAIQPPALIVSPLPGGIQAMIFKHPAEFAAQARADIAARTEFSGLSTVLIRRLKTNIRERLEEIFGSWKSIDWEKYRDKWLKNSQSGVREAIEPEGERLGPKLLVDPSSEDYEKDKFILDQIPGGESGVPMADRTIIPYLPGYYYDYFVGAYVTAGRARSVLAMDGPVRSMYDGPAYRNGQTPPETDRRRYRQRPWTYPVAWAEYNEQDNVLHLLHLRVRLVAPRLHLPPQIGRLWIESDRRIGLGNCQDPGIALGSLPDLDLGYLLALRTAPTPDQSVAEGQRPRLMLLCAITPPMASDKSTFLLKTFLPSLQPLINGSPVKEDETPLKVCQDTLYSLVIDFELKVLEPFPIEPIIAALRDTRKNTDGKTNIDIADLVYLASIRDGTVSELIPGR